MPTFLSSVTTISPGVTGSWQDVDVSAYCPVGTTGVILRCYNDATTSYGLGYRKKGSTDNRYGQQQAKTQCWVACGVDANRILEIYIGHADVFIRLVGYFGSEAVFFTDGIDKSVGAAGSWQEVDISADLNPGDSACLAFLEFAGLSGGEFGVRKKGSDAVTDTLYRHRGGMTGVDVNNRYENWIPGVSADVYLLGYLRAGAVVSDAVTVVTPGSTGSFVDLAPLPAGAIGGMYQIQGGSSYPVGLRCKGAAETTCPQIYYESYAMVKCDASRLVQAKITSTTQAIVTQLGYFTDLPTPAITNLSSASGYVGDSVTITGTGFNASQGTGSVTFNGTAATVTSWSDTSIVCTVPAGATTGNIVVTNVWGNASTGTAYTVKSLPTATAIGSGCPGDDVAIDGTDFGAAQGTVTFDATDANIVSWADAQIVVTVPVGAINCTVTITNGDGKTCTIGFALGDCGGASSTPETPIHTGNPIGAGPNVGLSPVR